MAKIAVTHPGKLGDALYTLPLMRHIYKTTGEKVDFWTSEYCRPMLRLMQNQSCIANAYIHQTYKAERFDLGVQPYQMHVNYADYERVYHAGFRMVPQFDLPRWIMAQCGIHHIDPEIYYEYDALAHPLQYDPYIVIAPRGETTWKQVFLDVIAKSPINVYIIGGPGDYIGAGHDKTDLDMYDTLPIIANAQAFIGIGSSQLVLANGFPNIKKVVPHHGFEYDMRHFLYSPNHFYLVNPSADQILNQIFT